MTMMAHQKSAFQDRLKRINTGQQFEHADVIGHQTQVAWVQKHGKNAKKPVLTARDRLAVMIAMICGGAAVFFGRLIYFYLTQLEGLPKAFYSLEGRGVALTALILALVMIVIFQLLTRGRLQALALGCALMHFGEAAVASSAPDLLTGLFPPDYVAVIAGDTAPTPAG